MCIVKNVHLKAHFEVPVQCTLQAHCNAHLQSEYKCALNDLTNVHQMYIRIQVCDVLCTVHIQGTFEVVCKVHLTCKEM